MNENEIETKPNDLENETEEKKKNAKKKHNEKELLKNEKKPVKDYPIDESTKNSSIEKDNTNHMSITIPPPKKKINLKSSHFPYCIVWTPIPLITYLFPSIGHSGIGNSAGIIHDFAGSFFVSVDDFAFGKPTKYVKLKLSQQEELEWDRAIEKGDNRFNMEEHNLFTKNCHSHVAYILNQINYKGRNNYNMVSVWWLLCTRGRYVSFCGFIRTYLGFLIIVSIILFIRYLKTAA